MTTTPSAPSGSATSSQPDLFRQETLTSEAYSRSSRTTCADTSTAISSPVSAAGPMRRASQAGRKTAPSGPDHVHVSRFRSLASNVAMPTSATSGPLFTASSPSAVLQRLLESRLRERLDVNGSPEFVLTWRQQDMPAGVPICQLRASARRTIGLGFTGWPTPTAQDHRRGIKPPRPWDTGIPLSQQVGIILLGWATPTAITNTGGAALCKWGGTGARQKLREAVGDTVLNGALNPAFPLWLMGFPDEWASCAAQGTPSSRKSARSSCEPFSLSRTRETNTLPSPPEPSDNA